MKQNQTKPVHQTKKAGPFPAARSWQHDENGQGALSGILPDQRPALTNEIEPVRFK
jgi:hypothetical protein